MKPNTVELKWDGAANMAYVKLYPGQITETKEIGPGVRVDYSGQEVVGIEIDDAKGATLVAHAEEPS